MKWHPRKTWRWALSSVGLVIVCLDTGWLTIEKIATPGLWLVAGTTLAVVVLLVVSFYKKNAKVDGLTATLQENAQAALQASEERYRLLFEENPQPIWVYEPGTLNFLAVNQAAVEQYGYSRRDFLAMSLKELLAYAEVPEPLLNPAGAFSGTWTHRTKDERLLEVEIKGSPFIFEKKRAVLVLANDVSERRLLEEQLRQLQKMEAVGQLAGGVAHDFNNLLNVIDGYAQLLKEGAAPNSRAAGQIGKIMAATKRAASLTGQLLTFSRKQVLAPQILDLNELVTELGRMLPRLIGEDIQVVLRQQPQLGRVNIDRTQIEQVLLNLAVNARDAMPKGGTLRIETSGYTLESSVAPGRGVVPGPYVMLSVTDSGCGMDAATQSRIFEPFFTTKEQGKGTGLGLATVYGIVKQSDGFIEVRSEVGQGSTFMVFLPQAAEADEAAESRAQAQISQAEADAVLVVEDEADLCAVCCDYLTFKGFTVFAAENGEQALEICRDGKTPIDVLITDVVMPRMSGPELAKAAVQVRPNLRVIYVSGYSDRTLDQETLAKAAAFLQKPYNLEALAGSIRSALGKGAGSPDPIPSQRTQKDEAHTALGFMESQSRGAWAGYRQGLTTRE
jgi:two-component system, cell cycle sensor histidine kinase and response regulator CckA